MAVYDLEEQEKIDALKAWWNQYGKLVFLALLAFVVAVAAVRGWQYYQRSRAAEAAALFVSLEKHVQDAQKLRGLAGSLMEQYPSSPYAARAALIAARSGFEAGDAEGARSQLKWAIEHSREDAIRDLARLRLAAIEYDQKQFAAALSLVEAKHGSAFDGLYSDLRGDILVAQGKLAEARAAYTSAIQRTEGGYRALIEVKLDALGETAK
jgi:predicted negative regulator of RcsB-dependent stress response